MIALAVIVICVTSIYVLYNVALNETRNHLIDIAHNHSKLIESIFQFNRQNPSSTFSGDAFEATLFQLKTAQSKFSGIGKTGEFTLAKKERGKIVFVLSHRHGKFLTTQEIPFDGTNAEPMRLALQGMAGTIIGLDYRGETVLAAYEPIEKLSLGIVAKIDMAELRAPYLYNGFAVVFLATVLSMLAAWIFESTTRSMGREIKESEERFRMLVNNAGDGVFLCNGKGDIIDVNDMACATLGYRREELLQLKISEIRTEVPLNQLQRLWNEIETGTSTTVEEIHRRKDGTTFPVEVRLTKINYGNEYHIIKVARDITERKEAEAKLIKDEQRFRALFESAADYALILEIQEDGPPIIVGANEAAFIKHGYNRAEMLGKPISFIDTNISQEQVKQRMAKILAGGVVRFEVEHQCKDGSTFYAEAAAKLLQQGEKKIFFSIERDISERKQANAIIEKLSQAVMQSGEAVVIADADGTIEYVNPAFTKITGYSEEEALGRNTSLLKSGTQPDRFYEEMWNTLLAGNPWQGKVVNRKKNGDFYPAMLTISPIKSESGEITNFIGLQQNLEEYESLEAQFHQAQKMEAIGTLVGGIAHDFNNLLAGMMGNVYLAKKRAKGDPDLVEKLTTVEVLSHRAAELIKQLLTFARKGIVDMRPIPLNPFLKEALKLLRASIPENIALRHDITADPLVVKGDATQLHQILMNLLNNAHDAVEAKKNPYIHVRLEKMYADADFAGQHPGFSIGTYAHLNVEDNGYGISEEKMEHLFEPFFTTKSQGKGTGLGLAMTYGAIQSHHGQIEVESSVGAGSCFHIYLPLLESEKDSDKATSDAELLAQGHGELILLVDDDEHAREAAHHVLESLGYRTLEASDGMQAVELFSQNSAKIDLVISDVVMPKLNGVEAFNRMRAVRSDVNVIFLTGYDMGAMTAENIPSSEHTILNKPYSIYKFSQTIRTQLDSSH